MDGRGSSDRASSQGTRTPYSTKKRRGSSTSGTKRVSGATLNRCVSPTNISTQKSIAIRSEQSGHTDTVQYKKAAREFHFRHETRFRRDPQPMRLANKHFNAEIYRYMWGPNEYTITGTLKKADLAGQLKKLKMPVLFTCGKYEAADPATVNKFVRITPHARMAVFSRSAHMPHLKEPKKYFKTILK